MNCVPRTYQTSNSSPQINATSGYGFKSGGLDLNWRFVRRVFTVKLIKRIVCGRWKGVFDISAFQGFTVRFYWFDMSRMKFARVYLWQLMLGRQPEM